MGEETYRWLFMQNHPQTDRMDLPSNRVLDISPQYVRAFKYVQRDNEDALFVHEEQFDTFLCTYEHATPHHYERLEEIARFKDSDAFDSWFEENVFGPTRCNGRRTPAPNARKCERLSF